jgi:hypothetical protein
VLVTGAVGRQTAAMSKRPRVDQDLLHRQAQVAFLAGLLRGDDIDALIASVAPCDVPGWFTPDVAILELAATALDLATAPGSAPLEYEGLRERYLPEIEFRGRVEHRSSQYALYAAACMRGGLQPDLLNDAGWWQDPTVDLRGLRHGDLHPSRRRPPQHQPSSKSFTTWRLGTGSSRTWNSASGRANSIRK